jgi:hypothetical protein
MHQFAGSYYQNPQFINLMRSMKGAPLSVFLYLATAYRALGRNDLVILTGYGKDSVAKALNLLETTGIAYHEERRNGWLLNPDLKPLSSTHIYAALPILAVPPQPWNEEAFQNSLNPNGVVSALTSLQAEVQPDGSY